MTRPFTSVSVPSVVSIGRMRLAFVAASAWVAVLGAPLDALAQAAEPAGASQAPAQDADAQARWKALIASGLEKFQQKSFDGALEAFQAAWRIQEHAELAASLAETQMKLGRFAEAAEHWEYYLAHGPLDREEAEAALAECRKHLGAVRMSMDALGATLAVNGRTIPRWSATSDGGAVQIWLAPGTHRLQAHRDGRASAPATVTVEAGKVSRVRLRWLPEAASGTAGASDGARSPERHDAGARGAAGQNSPDGASGIDTPTAVLIGGGALTLATLALGVGATLESRSLDAEVERLYAVVRRSSDPSVPSDQACAQPVVPSACPALRDAVHERARFSDIAKVSFVAAGAFGVGTLLGYALWPREPREGAASVGFHVRPGLRDGGVTVRLVF